MMSICMKKLGGLMINKAKGTYDVLPTESHKWASLEESQRDFNVIWL